MIWLEEINWRPDILSIHLCALTIFYQLKLAAFSFQKVVIHEVDEGQPCLACTDDKCPGFTPHEWRFIHC